MDDKLIKVLQAPIRFLNHTEIKSIFDEDNQAITSFAIDDSIATTVGQQVSPPTFRLWVHDNTVVLGIPDSRVPYFSAGVRMLHQKGYQTVIRNSGGLAVALDYGVLNLSIILPNDGTVTIHEGYDFMVAFIQLLFKEYTSDIKAYEIVGSYCPGDYDLSINGVKFAGISQRRVRDGVAVQIYLDIEGDSKERAKLVREFYSVGIANEPTKYVYPAVNPAVMGSLNELLDQNFTVIEIAKKIELLLKSKNEKELSTQLSAEEEAIFLRRIKQMERRNEIITNIM